MDKFNRKLTDIYILFKYGFRLNKPLLNFRIVRSYFKALIEPGNRPLKYIDFAIDYRCNLRCRHCFAVSLTKINQKEMTVGDYRKIAKMCEEMGVLHISFQGGEPLIIPSLESVIRSFNPNKFYIGITTNGTYLTPEKVRWLKKIGVDKITVSLDSMIPEEHDRFRNVPGTFDKAMSGIREALRQKFRVTLNTTLTHQNLHSEGIRKIFEFSRKNKVIVNPIFAAPAGRWINSTQFMLTPDDVGFVAGLQKQNPYLRRDLDSNYYGRGCPAVKEVIYVDAYGNVLPCPFLHITLGNLTKSHLRDIISNGLSFGPFAGYSKICLAAEDRNFLNIVQKTYKIVKHMPFTLAELKKTHGSIS